MTNYELLIGTNLLKMKTDNVIQTKSYAFAVRIVKMYKYLAENKKDLILAKQVVRSGTSIGANIEEAIGGQSEKDFFAKMTLAYKEARETQYWIRLLLDTDYIDGKQAESILADLEELLKIITSIQKTIKSKTNE